jgi:hypothetical protein
MQMQSLHSILSDTAEKIGWPMPVNYPAASAEDKRAFENAFSNLLKLQTMLVPFHDFFLRLSIPILVRGEKIRLPRVAARSEKEGLYPLQALVHPISLRFKYHFDGSRQTNRLDKVEC